MPVDVVAEPDSVSLRPQTRVPLKVFERNPFNLFDFFRVGLWLLDTAAKKKMRYLVFNHLIVEFGNVPALETIDEWHF